MKINLKPSNSSTNLSSQGGESTSEFHSWHDRRGSWLAYVLGVYLLQLIYLSLPFLSVASVWTLTLVTHNVIMYLALHHAKGSIWTDSQGIERYLTQWEQMDNGEQYTANRKFYTVVPIIVFFIATFYSKYNTIHFAINLISTLFVTLAKLPMFHGVRILGINKY